jgi:hypothetical protein
MKSMGELFVSIYIIIFTYGHFSCSKLVYFYLIRSNVEHFLLFDHEIVHGVYNKVVEYELHFVKSNLSCLFQEALLVCNAQ